jgi:hypothetical protein
MSSPKSGPVFTVILLLALAFPPQQSSSLLGTKGPIPPDQELAWQLERLTQGEIRKEVTTRGLTDRAEAPMLAVLSAIGADTEAINAVRHAPGPRIIWKQGYGCQAQQAICMKWRERWHATTGKRRRGHCR